jgi:DNA-binding transcriptional LysR family regulator
MGSPGVWRLGRNEEQPTALQSRLIVNTSEAAIDAAVAGVGLTRLLSYQVADHVKAKTLKIVLADFEPKSWPVHLIYRGNVRIPLKLRAFLDFAAPRLRQTMARARLH